VTRSSWLAGLASVVLGCNGGTLPPPGIVSVQPATRAASASGDVTVVLDAVLPTVANYGANSAAIDDTMTLRIGTRPFGPTRWTDGGVVSDFLPSVLPEGQYDVTLELGDGRLATAEGAFTVTPGDWPSSYSIDPIPGETSGVPFGVTLRANGPAAGGFGGTVSLAVPGATVTPSISGPFQNGVRVEVITVTGSGMRRLVVSDLVSNSGQSNPFLVQ
jgi:hypothetical protein